MNRFAAVAFLLSLFLGPNVFGQKITKVEVDWEIVLNQPDSTSGSPQISIVMAGTPSLNYDYAEFRLNPEDANAVGGLKIDTWWAGDRILATDHLPKQQLSSNGDVIRITTQLEAQGSNTYYRVTKLSSNEWGNVPQNQLPNNYSQITGAISFSIDLTLQESEVELGRNRVQKMVAKEIRYYASRRLVSQDNKGYVVHEAGSDYSDTELSDSVVDQKTAY